jgi:hypothetical protein
MKRQNIILTVTTADRPRVEDAKRISVRLPKVGARHFANQSQFS